MKYLVRSIKYFFYLLVILVAVILALVLTGVVEADLSKMFINGYDSLWQMGIMIALFALIYPRFGFSTRRILLPGDPQETRRTVISVMEARGYVLENDGPDSFSFRRKGGFSRALKMWEDRITFSPIATGYEAEGLTRDLARTVSAVEATLPEDE